MLCLTLISTGGSQPAIVHEDFNQIAYSFSKRFALENSLISEVTPTPKESHSPGRGVAVVSRVICRITCRGVSEVSPYKSATIQRILELARTL